MELLVVLGIIGILVALLLPVLSRVKESAKMTSCMNNLKQISLAVTMYEQDNAGRLPTLGTRSEENGRWMWQLMPYLENDDVFTAPKLPRSRYDGSRWSDETGYGWAQHLKAKSGYDTPNVMGYKVTQIAKPSETICLGDTGFNGIPGWLLYRRDPRNSKWDHDNRPGYFPQFRHKTSKTKTIRDTEYAKDRELPIKGLCMFGFLDGHAEALSPKETFVTDTTEGGEKLTGADRFLLWNLY